MVLLLVIFGTYSFFFKKSPEEEAALVRETATPAESAVVREFLALLGTLNRLTLDTSIFGSPLFKSLRDESVELAPQTQGRENPFAPL